MKKSFVVFILFSAFTNYTYSQICNFTSSGRWDKSGGGQAVYSCDVGDLNTATDIYIDPGVEVTIEKQSSDVQWSANVIVEGTLILKTKLILAEPPTCDLTLTVATGGVLTSSNGNGANELLIICGNVILSNSQGSGIYNWDDFPNGEITGPQIIDDTGGTLPVELLYFDAQSSDQHIQLNWATASELNNDYFTLERSKNGFDFEKLAIVNGNGTSSETLNYKYIDVNPYLGISYYKLSQTDYDGTTEVFPVISELFKPGANNLSIIPNPIDESGFRLQSSGLEKQEAVKLKIIDLHGKSVEERHLVSDAFGNLDQQILLVKSLKTGTYIIELATQSNTQYQKIIAK